jgi:putative transposase
VSNLPPRFLCCRKIQNFARKVKCMQSKNDWRTGRHCVFKNYVHLVFVPKYRKKVFTNEMIARLSDLFSETCSQMDCNLLEFNGEADHVHLLIELHPKHSIANIVGKLKGKSSYFLRREFTKQLEKKLWGNHLWTHSYCAVSCGGAPLEIVKLYIENQNSPTP